MISCKIVLANTSTNESIIISPQVRQCTAELSASVNRNLLLRFNDGISLVVHSQVLAYYSTRFYDNYRLNRYNVKVKDDARVARDLVQFHYIGMLQIPFSHVEKYFLVASQLEFDIALEVLSQLLEKFSHRNDYYAIICANIACEPNNQVAAPCIKSIIYCAAAFLKSRSAFGSCKTFATPNAMYRILQVFALSAGWKKSLKLALEWIVYEEWRYLYADSILDAVVFQASDELITVVQDELLRLPKEVGEVLRQRVDQVMYRYLAHESISNAEDETAPVGRSRAYSEVKARSTSTETAMHSQPPTWSSETESLLLPACSSAKIFDEFLLDDSTQQMYTSNSNLKTLTPSANCIDLVPRARLIKQQQTTASELSGERRRQCPQEAEILNTSKKIVSDGSYSKRTEPKVTKEMDTSEVSSDKNELVEIEEESSPEEPLLLNLCIPSDAQALSCFDEPLLPFSTDAKVDFFQKNKQTNFSANFNDLEITRREKRLRWKITKKIEFLGKLGFVAAIKPSDNAFTV
uniref:BTB domain-containing protein n=1 Tax=Setaria digitata TaxID=48799 RepID=A0A915PKW9_9BILA